MTNFIINIVVDDTLLNLCDYDDVKCANMKNVFLDYLMFMHDLIVKMIIWDYIVILLCLCAQRTLRRILLTDKNDSAVSVRRFLFRLNQQNISV